MSAVVVNHDNPANTTPTSLTPPRIVYGGSEASTSDTLTVGFAAPSPAPTMITWSVTGPPGGTYTPPAPSATADPWHVGSVLPVPGLYTFSANPSFADGSTRTGSILIEVGIRTDDVIVVGWINPAGVTLPSIIGLQNWVSINLPPEGPVDDVLTQVFCTRILLQLSQFRRSPFGLTFNDNDRTYLIYWLFKYSGNPDPSTVIPGGDLRDPTNTMISNSKVAAYQAVLTNYKLFNRLQVRFRTWATEFNGARVVLQQAVGIGTTHSPISPPPATLLFPGQAGPANSKYTAFVGGPVDHVSLINDGSPTKAGINAYNDLSGNLASPVLWENIGSEILFTWNGGTAPTTKVQPYPTYYVYRNGTLVSTFAQAPSPLANFAVNPYPFGTVTSGTPPNTVPGGRNGDATSPADLTARIPPSGYTLG
jgi:hypothetical protein